MGNTPFEDTPPSEADSSAWSTRISPEQTRPFGVEALHTVWFEPDNWPGTGPTVFLQIPEGKIFSTSLTSNVVPIVLIHPPQKIKYALRKACSMAAEEKACLILHCDTPDQAERAAKKAARLLPRHKRAAVKRIYDARAETSSPETGCLNVKLF